MGSPRGLILLDRDGVINPMVVDLEHGTIDSPMNASQARILDGVPAALGELCAADFAIAIVTNQPAAAKGKTTRANLEAAHAEIVRQAESRGGRISSSHICFHRSEDGCGCRKPKAGLLEEALRSNPGFDKDRIWMAGDGVIDVQAGQAFGVRTAFLGPRKSDLARVLIELKAEPTAWFASLPELAKFLISNGDPK